MLLFVGLLAGCAASVEETPDPVLPEVQNEDADVPVRRVGETKEVSTETGTMTGSRLEGDASTLELAFDGPADEVMVQVVLDEEPMHPVRIRIYHGGSEEALRTVEDHVEEEYTLFIYGLTGPWRVTVDTTLPDPGFAWTLRVTQNTFVPIE